MAPKRKPLSAAVEKSLRAKAEKSRFTYRQLAAVYRRGQGAYFSSGSRPGQSSHSWGCGRVRSFATGKGGARKADKDLLRSKRKKGLVS